MENHSRIHKGSVLISGGSGMIGRYLTSVLLSAGYKVSHLSRDINQFGVVRVYRWDPGKKILDPEYLRGVDFLIHLAGANLGDKRWTQYRRKEILRSRIDSARLLFETASRHSIMPKVFITASGIGYYGTVTSDRIFNEEDPSSGGFLGELCKKWEEAAESFKTSGVRTVSIRSALVLEKSDSGLSRLIKLAKYGFVTRIGSGKQYMPWIHISDLCGIYLKAIEDPHISGAYNAVAPHHVSHNEFMKILARVMKRPVFIPPVPGFLVRAVMGEMSDIILEGSRVSSERIIKAGYRFKFEGLHGALEDIINA